MKESNSSDPLPMEVDVHETQALLNTSEPVILLDVREDLEVQACHIKGYVHIPMMYLPARMHSLPRDQRILVYCHHGLRSLRATEFLRAHGWPNAQSIKGGINAWSLEIDPSVPRY